MASTFEPNAPIPPTARTAAQGRCHVAVACSQVLGWPDNSLLMHAGLMLSETGTDELDIPVEPSLLGDEVRGNLPIQVSNPNEDPTRLLSLGASSVRIEAMSFNGEKLAA